MFAVALSNVLITLLYILPGFLLCKARRAVADHLSSMSAVLIYFCSPCMIVSALIEQEYSFERLLQMAEFFVVTLALQAAFLALLYLILRKKFDDSRVRVFSIASIAGNVGFFGLPIVRALVPDHPEVAAYSAVYVVSMNVIVFTLGVYFLTKNKKHMSLRSAIINPSTLAFLVGLPLFILGAKNFLPDVLQGALRTVSGMTTLLCMVILGIRLATVPFRKLFTRPTVYLACLSKLLVFPLFCFAAVYFLPLDDAFRAAILILSATPCASVVFNLAEMHRSETELSANCLLVSTLLCFLTIPLLALLL